MVDAILFMVLALVAVAGAELVRLTVRRQLTNPVTVAQQVTSPEPVVVGAVDVD